MRIARLLTDNAEEFLGVGLVIAIGAIMAAQVFLRTVFDAPMSWPEELSQFFMVWAALFGGIGALKRSELICVDFLPPRLSVSAAALLIWLQAALMLVLLAAVLIGGYELAGRSRMRAASMPLSWYWAYSAAPVFALVAAIRLVQKSLGYEFLFVAPTGSDPSVETTQEVG